MKNGDEISATQSTEFSENRLAEIAYHRKLTPWMVYLALPTYLFFVIYYYRHGDLVQTLLFASLLANALTALFLGPRIKDLAHLVLLKRISGGLAFGLLTTSFIVGLTGDRFFLFFPWIFSFPVAMLLFFGRRTGFTVAFLFSALTVTILFIADFPAFDSETEANFRVASSAAILAMLGIGVLSEKARVRIQKDLVDARKVSQTAADQQRQANLELQREIDLRKQSQADLAQSEVRYRALFEESAASLWEEDWSRVKNYVDTLPPEAAKDMEAYLKSNPAATHRCMGLFRVNAVNQGTLKIYGADSLESLKRNITCVLPPEAERHTAERIGAIYHTGEYNTEVDVHTVDGKPLRILAKSTIPAGFETSWAKVFTTIYDITERVAMAQQKKRVERQMAQAQQFQAVGTLAGGIAHQFNNALSIIYGNLEMLEMQTEAQPKVQKSINALKTTAKRMDQLTNQLLAYAQGGKYRPKTFSANDLIHEILNAGDFSPPSSIRILSQLDPAICETTGDTTQIRMVIQAVLSNAFESIETRGDVKIRTGSKCIDSVPPGTESELAPGRYAVIRIEDDGAGMDEASRRRVFEPFFSTKFLGRGLGMAAAYGIVRNHDGMIRVDSTLNQGTRVTIYLPVSEDTPGEGLVKQTVNAA